MPHGWDNFFTMAGTSAATLIGLLFIAVSVSTGFPTSRMVHGARGFLTPTFVHFGAVLFECLAVLAPWSSARPIGIILGLGGIAGLAYQIRVIAVRREFASPLLDWYDQLPYLVVPSLGHASLIVGATGLIATKSFGPYAVAGAITLLLFAGIYGAWDITLWIVTNRDTSER
jgi:hypothetical protein